MKFSRAFIICGAVVSVSAIDCTSYPLWVPSIYPSGGNLVKHEQVLYKNQWYAISSQVPGVDALWEVVDTCTSGGDTDVTLDCSTLSLWHPESIYTPPMQVVHNHRVWENVYYAKGEAEEPGVAGGWSTLGSCGGDAPVVPPTTNFATAPSTGRQTGQQTDAPAITQRPVQSTYAPTVAPPTVAPPTAAPQTVPPPTGAGVDCSSAHRWSGTYVYRVKEELAHYRNQLYKQDYYTIGVFPDTLQGWILVGDCIPGTNTLGVPSGSTGLGPVGEERLCSCCKGCATYSGNTPICLDEITDEWKCINTWCPMYNSFDAEMCQKVKDEGMLNWYSGELMAGNTNWPERVFIPYIDVSLGKIPLLTDVHAATGASYFVLAFVTAMSSGCSGGFGGFTPVAQGATWWASSGEINIYSQVHEIRKLGGDVIVSLGGAIGTELADAPGCNTVEKLKKAYEAVLDATKSTVLDFDIEGAAALSSKQDTAWKNRFEAVKQITTERPGTQVWWTLATWPRGLTDDGKLFIRDLMKSGARFDAINLMTMDYGEKDDVQCRVDGKADMHLCEQQAIDSVAQNLFDAAQELGLLDKYAWKSFTDAYKVLGSTTMIGVNDVVSEIYYLTDAERSMKVWKEQKPIKLISQWSLARDSPCATVGAAGPTCSGANVQSEDFAYARFFQQFME